MSSEACQRKRLTATSRSASPRLRNRSKKLSSLISLLVVAPLERPLAAAARRSPLQPASAPRTAAATGRLRACPVNESRPVRWHPRAVCKVKPRRPASAKRGRAPRRPLWQSCINVRGKRSRPPAIRLTIGRPMRDEISLGPDHPDLRWVSKKKHEESDEEGTLRNHRRSPRWRSAAWPRPRGSRCSATPAWVSATTSTTTAASAARRRRRHRPTTCAPSPASASAST